VPPSRKPSGLRLQFVCGQELSSRLIAWYGNGYGGFSHVDAVMPDGSLLGARDDAIYVEGRDGDWSRIAPGVRLRPPEYETWARKAVIQIPCSPANANRWEEFLRGQIGQPYDSGSIWGFVLGIRSHQTGHWICSALQSAALQDIGLMGRTTVPTNQITPDALYLLATAGLGGQQV